jgi:hypothetical protein
LRFWDLGSQSKVYGFIRVSFEQYFYIRARGRKEIVLSEGISGVGSLFRDIDEATRAHRTAAMVRQLREGGSVDLGPWRLSPGDIQAGRKRLPWTEVAGAEVHNGYILNRAGIIGDCVC